MPFATCPNSGLQSRRVGKKIEEVTSLEGKPFRKDLLFFSQYPKEQAYLLTIICKTFKSNAFGWISVPVPFYQKDSYIVSLKAKGNDAAKWILYFVMQQGHFSITVLSFFCTQFININRLRLDL